MNPKHIAEEAATSMVTTGYVKREHKQVIRERIQSAIEKVDEQWRERFRKFEKIEEKFGPASQRAAYAIGEWHPCEHCKQFAKSVQILDANCYSVGEAKDWDSAVTICDAHNACGLAMKEVCKEQDAWKRVANWDKRASETQQLARETWLKFEACMTAQEEQDAIQTAIEKARKAGYTEGYTDWLCHIA